MPVVIIFIAPSMSCSHLVKVFTQTACWQLFSHNLNSVTVTRVASSPWWMPDAELSSSQVCQQRGWRWDKLSSLRHLPGFNLAQWDTAILGLLSCLSRGWGISDASGQWLGWWCGSLWHHDGGWCRVAEGKMRVFCGIKMMRDFWCQSHERVWRKRMGLRWWQFSVASQLAESGAGLRGQKGMGFLWYHARNDEDYLRRHHDRVWRRVAGARSRLICSTLGEATIKRSSSV